MPRYHAKELISQGSLRCPRQELRSFERRRFGLDDSIFCSDAATIDDRTHGGDPSPRMSNAACRYRKSSHVTSVQGCLKRDVWSGTSGVRDSARPAQSSRPEERRRFWCSGSRSSSLTASALESDFATSINWSWSGSIDYFRRSWMPSCVRRIADSARKSKDGVGLLIKRRALSLPPAEVAFYPVRPPSDYPRPSRVSRLGSRGGG